MWPFRSAIATTSPRVAIQPVSAMPSIHLARPPTRTARRPRWPQALLELSRPRPTPSQTPQSARREDEGEAPEPAERPECPDEEEAAGGLGDLAVMCPPHVDDGHACREQPDEQHDGVPRS